MLVRKCIKCGQVKILRDFFDGPVTKARSCTACRHQVKLDNQKKAHTAKRRNHILSAPVQFDRAHPYFASLLRKLDVPTVKYLVGIREQEYKCKACGALMDKYLYPDLDQKKHLRGFLCKKCSKMLRIGGASTGLLLDLVNYLLKGNGK